MDVGADAAGQVISLAGQVFKIGMEGMVVVVKIAGKGAVHAAALLAAALSGKKKTRGKVMLKNMLRDSKGITLFTIRDEDLKKFAKEAKAYNVRYCIVKDRKQDRDGNTDMFIRAEDAAVVNRIIERFGLTAVKQDVYMEGTPEGSYGDPVKDGDYVYGDVTISREINSLVEGETETQIKTRVPGTYGRDVRYVYFDKDGLEEVHGGRSYKVHIDPDGSYELYGADGAAVSTVKGEELLRHYDRHDNETPGNSKARTASEAQSGRSYSGQGVTEKDAVTCTAFESYYEYSRNDERYLFDERCRLLSIGEDGSVGAYPGHEGFFKNEDELNAFLAGRGELRLVTKEELLEMAAGRSAAPERSVSKDAPAARSPESTGTADREEKPAPAYVYGDVTISRDKNSLVEEETETQIRTRVPGTYKKDVRYVYFDKDGLEEIHGGRSYKVHIEPEKIYELYDRSGAAAGSVYGEELLTHYDRKDRDGVTAKDPEAGESLQSEKSAAEPDVAATPYEPEDSGVDAGQPDVGPVQEKRESQGTTVKTNMGEMPVEDYREIMAGQYGFDSYEEFYAKGWRLGDGYDKEPEPETPATETSPEPEKTEAVQKYDVLAVNGDGEILAYTFDEDTFYKDDRNGMTVLSNTKLPRPEPRSEAEFRPSVREKLSGYKKEEEDAALKRQIEAAEAKRAAETRELEKTGGDVLPGQREKIESYKESRDAAMADFLSDAKLHDRG